MTDCKTCLEIKEIEHQLDIRAQEIVQRVITLCQPIRERNNKRWEKFARLCNLPMVGGFTQNTLVMPMGLESEPEYYKEGWYRTLGRQIEVEARELESKKVAHLEHWGDEVVSPMDCSDPGGYYTPSRTSRRDCHEHGLTAFVPNKFDFSSAAGCHKYDVGKLVMCSTTKRLAQMNDCDMRADSRGVRYWLRKYSQPDPTIPGFGEWRTDAQVTQARRAFETITVR